MKRFVIAIALACVMSSPALAGLIPSVPVAPPPPDATSAPSAPGDVPTVGLTEEISEAALDLVQLVLSAVV
jgi:hypothetical protein